VRQQMTILTERARQLENIKAVNKLSSLNYKEKWGPYSNI